MSEKSFGQTSIRDAVMIDIPVVHDRRGNLAFIESKGLPFRFRRVYYLFDIPSGARRGGHAHRAQDEWLIALSGSFDVILWDGKQERRITLNRPDKALSIPRGLWRELENFSSGAVCLVLNTDFFDESDYIRRKEDFLGEKGIVE